MSATPSLRPMFAFPGWVIERIDIDWNIKHAFVHLRRDGRIQHVRCSKCETPMGQMKTNDRSVQDLPLGTLRILVNLNTYSVSFEHPELLTHCPV
ncbi:hypothetical protein [Endozoicomonas sp. SCSIO W0465]|uniref:hypothetical protein n=1 Tax=Endozoicomonas sp. SCSIO W0465 TaxID=2918516 RepID=UPI0020753D44|nr:hypothetical protein [Endozoicomonas sp. SCSIO W0465]USE33914.1 hypothetical protein MJO57_17225 [Endozoicomonas sp. SCSIO W0465]